MSEANSSQETQATDTPNNTPSAEPETNISSNAEENNTINGDNTNNANNTILSDSIISDRIAAALAHATRDGVNTAITDAIRGARVNRVVALPRAARLPRGTAAAEPSRDGHRRIPVVSTVFRNGVAHTHSHNHHLHQQHPQQQQQQQQQQQPQPQPQQPASQEQPQEQPQSLPQPTVGTPGTSAQSIGRPNVSVETNAQGARIARVEIGRGNFVTVPLNRNENAVNVRVIQIEPLVPTPINDNGSNQATDDDESLQKYKCSICCEFMKEPVGCGKSGCSSRFCKACLHRVMAETVSRARNNNNQNNNNNHNNNNSNTPKCPTCRVEFSSMVVDESLKQEMHNGPTVACRFEGCNEQLKLPLVGDHEKVCDHVLMKCRYSSFGCSWTGKRGMIASHESNDCALAKISNFIEQYRQLRGDHTSRLEMVQQQVVGSMRMNNVHRQNLQRDQLKTPMNLFDVMQYLHALMCTTPFFFFTKDKWASLFRSNEARGAVMNFLVFLPTIIACISTSSNGYGIIFELLDQRNQATPSQQSMLLEEALICICIGALGILILVGNFVDSKSSLKWGRFAVRNLDKPPVMCDVLAVAIFTIHLSIMEYHGADIKSLVLWWCLAILTTFFPALVATISHAAARHMTSAIAPDSVNIMSMARALEPFLFGMRYSVLATFVGMGPCIDTPIIMSAIPKTSLNKLSKHLQMKNCFFEGVPKKFVAAYIGIRLGRITAGVENYDEIPFEFVWWFLETGLAIITLLALTILLGCLFELGISAGNRIVTQAQTEVRPDGVQKDHNLLGMFCYGGWMSLLGILTQFR